MSDLEKMARECADEIRSDIHLGRQGSWRGNLEAIAAIIKPHLERATENLRSELEQEKQRGLQARRHYEEKVALEHACGELNAYATDLAIELEGWVGNKWPDALHRWHKRDHSPEKKWGEPIVEELKQLREGYAHLRTELAELRDKVNGACVWLQGGDDVEAAAKRLVETNRANQQSTIQLTEQLAEARRDKEMMKRVGNALLEQDERWGLYGDDSKKAREEFKAWLSAQTKDAR